MTDPNVVPAAVVPAVTPAFSLNPGTPVVAPVEAPVGIQPPVDVPAVLLQHPGTTQAPAVAVTPATVAPVPAVAPDVAPAPTPVPTSLQSQFSAGPVGSSMAELTGLKWDGLKERRGFEKLPQMTGTFRLIECGSTEEPTHETCIGHFDFKCQVVGVDDLVPDAGDHRTKAEIAGELVSSESMHTESFWAMKAAPKDASERAKAFLVDAGVQVPPGDHPLGFVMELAKQQQLMFPGKIEHRPNKKDPQNPYAGLTVIARA